MMLDADIVQLQAPVPFSRSMVWDLMARYFRERGVAAWREEEVPHYVTTNPFIGAAYAEVVFAAWLDQRNLGRWPAACGQPLYICELGAGTGRLAFHFLRRLGELAERAGLGGRAFRYVLTDMAESNLEFWQSHPALQRYFRSGVLDCAVFDATRDSTISLRRSGKVLGPGDLALPMVVIANYVFDGLPQDLLYVDKQQVQECQVGLWGPRQGSEPSEPSEMLAALEYRYERAPLAAQAYPEPWLMELVGGYRNALADTHVLLPAEGLRCLHRLRALAPAGMLLLTADKGSHNIEDLQGRSVPRAAHHGSISLDVNYHAIRSYCEQQGGVAWFPDAQHATLDVGACLFAADASAWRETRHACQRHLHAFGPDDFFTLTRHAGSTLEGMQVHDVLAYLRLSRHDPHQCMRYLPRLVELAPGFDTRQKIAVAQALEAVWANYYPLGEATDLAHLMGQLFYGMGDYDHALSAFMRSAQLHGSESETMINMAACHYMLDRPAAAHRLLEAVLRQEPANEAAIELRALLAPRTPTAMPA